VAAPTTTAGTFAYNLLSVVYQTAPACSNTITGTVTITVKSCFKTLTLTSVMLEGLYNGGGTMRRANNDLGPIFTDPLISDTITVELHNATYSSIAYKATNVNLSTTGTATITVPVAYNGSYYITIRHRNHIETTTAAPVSFSGGTISYAYDLPSKVYGSNLILMAGPGNHYAVYGGDSNGDGAVDILDILGVQNDAFTFASGYLLTDLNGDGTVDVLDLIMAQNNAFLFISLINP
jgi:hypothetical protein